YEGLDPEWGSEQQFEFAGTPDTDKEPACDPGHNRAAAESTDDSKGSGEEPRRGRSGRAERGPGQWNPPVVRERQDANGPNSGTDTILSEHQPFDWARVGFGRLPTAQANRTLGLAPGG